MRGPGPAAYSQLGLCFTVSADTQAPSPVEPWPCGRPYDGAAATQSPRPLGDKGRPRSRPVRARPWAKSVTY